MNNTPQLYDDLMQRYLDVCNRALTFNKERFPFKQILGAAEKREHDVLIEVNIYSKNMDQASYVLSIQNGIITAAPHADCDDCECVREWNIAEGYLKSVTDDPECYINNPAKIDWDWMYDTSSTR